MFFCVEMFAQLCTKVPPLHHHTSWNFPATMNITSAPNGKSSPRCGLFFIRSYADLPSPATWHLFRRSVARSTIHGNTGEWTRKKTHHFARKVKKNHSGHPSSTDLIPHSMKPFDCESATGECSNSVPRDPRRFAISLKTSTIASS